MYKAIQVVFSTILLFCISPETIHAQTIYTNIDPDVYLTAPMVNIWYYYEVDVNNDSVPEFKIGNLNDYLIFRSRVEPLNQTEFINNSTYADALNYGDTIDENDPWISSTLTLFQYGQTSEWYNSPDRFLAFRFISQNDTLYGWIRLYITLNGMAGQVQIKDYAYSVQPHIIAGDGIIPSVENLKVSDISNNRNGSDIKIEFDKMVDESHVEVYRIIVVKESESPSFSINDAINIDSLNYFEVQTDGFNISDSLLPDSRDKNGDMIQEFIPYNIFILTVYDTLSPDTFLLSTPSERLVLTSPNVPVTNLTVAKTYLGGTTYNLQISFSKAADESGISEYRVLFVKSISSGTFNSDSALLVSVGNYYTLIPNGASQQCTMISDTLKDYKGQLLLHKTNYVVFVFSVADGVIANVSTLSLPSVSFSLVTPALPPSGIVAEDISENGGSSDLRITFRQAYADTSFHPYRIYGVRLQDAPAFNINTALSLPSGCYDTVYCTGSSVNVSITDSLKDNLNEFITENIPYRFFLLSMKDSIYSDSSTISSYSNIITLHNPSYFKTGMNSGQGVTYFDIDPDSVLIEMWGSGEKTETYELDLNHDGINDYKFQSYYQISPGHTYRNATVEPLNNSEVCLVQSGLIDPDPMYSGCMLSNDLAWTNSMSTLSLYWFSGYNYTGSAGIWNNIYDKFMGLRLVVNNDTLYGWVRITMTPPRIIFKDYAWYRDVTHIGENSEIHNVSIFPNPVKDILCFSFEDDLMLPNEYSIKNIQGETVLSGNNISANFYCIQFNHLPDGLYILQLRYNNDIVNRKIIIEH